SNSRIHKKDTAPRNYEERFFFYLLVKRFLPVLYSRIRVYDTGLCFFSLFLHCPHWLSGPDQHLRIHCREQLHHHMVTIPPVDIHGAPINVQDEIENVQVIGSDYTR
ncbi:MAG: hypothetical protein J6P43_07630, partial [Succinivibrionaceae bacterium]|nr:hypothetical protein [Succinivibrionaceae bacterium]